MSSQDTCPTDLGIYDYLLGWILIVGTFVSYVPQYIKIYQLRSHMGLSFSSFSFANLTSCGSLANYMAIEYSSTFFCCGAGVSFLNCSGAYLAWGQLVSIWICQHLIIVFFVLYYDHEFESDKESSPGANYRNVIVGCWIQGIVELLAAAVLIGIDILFGTGSQTTYIYGVVLMGFTSIVGALQLIPQIAETYRLRTLGSLSVITLVIQAFGTLLTAYNISTHGTWEVWTPFLVIALLQFVLIGQGWWYRYQTHGCDYCVCSINRKNGKLSFNVQVEGGGGTSSGPTGPSGYEEEVVSSNFSPPLLAGRDREAEDGDKGEGQPVGEGKVSEEGKEGEVERVKQGVAYERLEEPT